MDTKKLRQKILDLAIRGKLVPQDPNDEPASVLLERIRAEKQQLIKEGKIKAPKGSKACDTYHYEKEIPDGWCVTSLGEAFSLQAGKNISAADIHKESDMFPYPCYGGNGIRGYVNSYNRRGHFPLIGRQGALCGNINEVSGDFYATEHCVVVNTFAGVDVNWVIFLLKAMNLNQYATATAQPGLSVATVNEVQFCLPPYKEQKRIATTLNMYSKLIDCIDEESVSLSNAINITKSKILDLAISGKLVSQDPADEPAIELLKRINPGFKPCDNSHYEDLPIGWSICTLYDICDTINGLWKGKNPPFINVGVIRNANFTKDFNLDYSKIEYIDVEQRAFEKRNLEDGDLIVEKSGGSDNFPVGRSILYQGESGKYSFSNFTMALRIKDKSLIHSKYLYFVILHKYLSGEMTQMQTQTTGLHNLLSDKYMSMPIPIPPTNEQNRIIGCIEKLLNQLNNIKTVL